MAVLSTLDISTARPDGLPRKVRLQTDAAEKFRLVLLPTQDRIRLTIGPLQDSAGALLSNRLSWAMGPAGTFSNNASGTAVADGAVRGDIAATGSRDVVMPVVQGQRPAELVLWSDSTSAYAEIVIDAVE